MLNILGSDYEKTGRCDFSMAKETFMDYKSSFGAMAKNSPYTDRFTLEYKKELLRE